MKDLSQPLALKNLDQFDPFFLPPDLRVVKQLKEHIDLNFRNQQDPEFYVSQFGYTVRRMNKLTRHFLDRTVYELIQYRIHEEAVKLVSYTTLTVKEISDELGLCDPAWFCRCFKKETGLTPTEFRNLARKGLGVQ